jgi:hypothetical protein
MTWNNYRNEKYNAAKTIVGGRRYHSRLEANDALWLKSLEQQGIISDIEEQKRYRIFVNEQHICDSIVDFKFIRNGKIVWYETKGFVTKDYVIKKKLIYATLPENEFYLVNGTEKDILAI